jgi:FtsP/CotA-like multicopper oxidase with cupredoxin domain
VLRTTLVAAPTEVTLGGRTVEALTYGEGLTGPTLRLSNSDRLELTLVNHLDEPTNLHFHGAHVSPSGLGDNPFRRIEPGESGRYMVSFAGVRPGTLWYHAHVHGSVERQVFGGLSGVLIVDPGVGTLSPGLDQLQERLLALKAYSVVDGAIPASSTAAPLRYLVNDQVDPTIDLAPGESQVWRIANVGGDGWYRLRLDDHRFHVLIEDGQPVWEVWSTDELVLPPGKRFDVLIEAGAPGTYGLRTLPYDQGKHTYPGDLLAAVRVAGEETDPARVPTVIGPRSGDLSGEPVSAARTLALTEDEAAGTYGIDGVGYHPGHPFAEPEVYSLEEWTIRNPTNEQHPFHFHTYYFQVVEVNGVAYEAHGRQDTVVVPAGGSVVIRVPFYDFRGTVVFHCHLLSHEDGGMMGEVVVG